MNYRQLKRWMRRYCRHHRIPIANGFSVHSDHWGPAAQATARLVQKKARLQVNGKATTALIHTVKPFRLKVAAVAVKELGTKEWPPNSNWGVQVREFLRAAGIGGASPWCAAFVAWVLHHAGWPRGFPKLPGFVPSWETWGKGYLVNKFRASRGDLVTFCWDGKSGAGQGDHIGVILKNFGPLKQVATLEGNATSAAIPGGGVVRKWRLWSQVNCVIRLPDYP